MSEKQTILAVDDDPINLDLISELLQKDYAVLNASSGVDALEKSNNHNIDLILLDIMMPRMDGHEVLKRLKGSQKTKNIPVIFVTAKCDMNDEIMGFAYGAADYILKPIVPEILKARVQTQLELAKYRTQLEKVVEERTAELDEIYAIVGEMKNSIVQILEGERPEFNYFYNNPTIIHCRELLECDKKNCPAYDVKKNQRCWMLAGTHCRNEVQGNYAKKIGDCSKCKVYKAACLQPLHCLGETFHEMSALLSIWQDELVASNIRLKIEVEERAKLEKERQEIQKKVMIQDKLATLGQVATGVAHEINQPLTYITTIIQTTIERLKNNKIDPDKLIKKFQQAEHQAARILDITTHLRTVGRSDDAKREEVDLAAILDDSLVLMKEKMKLRNISLKANIPKAIPRVVGIHNKLEQVFINLTTNAIDALEKKGGGEITVEMIPEFDKIVIRYSDNGTGMPSEVKDRIFEPFYTTKERGKGTGLGMAIINDIIVDHNGEMTCESEEGKGTTFTITLPIT